uniref:Uncharacterized protein n=1 Tax=Ramularia collo-cygni TaxID=112498 RepID=A0A2D3V7E1_9PEZI
MEPADVQLGSLCLVSTTADLELQLNSCAEVAANDTTFTIEELLSKAMSYEAANRPWIMPGETFKLHVNLDIDVLGMNTHGLIQTFAQKLYDSKMWLELCLKPISMTLSNDRNVTLRISRTHDDVAVSGRPPVHKLSDNLSCGALSVHPDVPTLQLNSVHFAFRINQRQSSKRCTSKSFESDQCGPIDPDMLATRSQTHFDEPLVGDLRVATRSFEMSQAVRSEQYNPENSCGAPGLVPKYWPCSQKDILDLLDAGILNAITADPKRSARGIRLNESQSLKHLVDFAPSIWCPGYFTAVSSRSLLMPTISHALSQVGVGSARSGTLRAKFAEIARRARHPSSISSSSPNYVASRDSKSAQSCMELRLWQVAQDALQEDHCANRLEVLVREPDPSLDSDQHDVLDIDFILASNEECINHESDGSMIGLEDSGYTAEDELLSICASSRSCSPHDSIDISREMDQEMLCI